MFRKNENGFNKKEGRETMNFCKRVRKKIKRSWMNERRQENSRERRKRILKGFHQLNAFLKVTESLPTYNYKVPHIIEIEREKEREDQNLGMSKTWERKREEVGG